MEIKHSGKSDKVKALQHILMFNKRLTNAKMAPESFRQSQAMFAFFKFLLYLIWPCKMGSSGPQGFGCQRLGFVKKKVCVFSLGDTWLNMGCINSKWVCLLAEWQIPNILQLKKAGTQQPSSIKLFDFYCDWIYRRGEWRDVPTLTVMDLGK